MDIAVKVSKRGTCDRKRVGAIIVKDAHIISCGYNGSLNGLPHCDDVGHDMENDHCQRVVHAEANAILYAAKRGVALDGAAIYITVSPCWDCFKMIAQAGIKYVYYVEFYRDSRFLKYAKDLGIVVIHVDIVLDKE
jgi:dCMP deaminase